MGDLDPLSREREGAKRLGKRAKLEGLSLREYYNIFLKRLRLGITHVILSSLGKGTKSKWREMRSKRAMCQSWRM